MNKRPLLRASSNRAGPCRVNKYINKYNKFILNKHNLSYNFNNYNNNNYNNKDNIFNFINERYKFYFNNLNLLFDKDINK